MQDFKATIAAQCLDALHSEGAPKYGLSIQDWVDLYYDKSDSGCFATIDAAFEIAKKRRKFVCNDKRKERGKKFKAYQNSAEEDQDKTRNEWTEAWMDADKACR